MMEHAYYEGRNANRAGTPREDNPHADKSEAWFKGWDEAEEEPIQDWELDPRFNGAAELAKQMTRRTPLEDLLNKDQKDRTPLEQCIVDACALEDLRDGDYTRQELALQELEHIRRKEWESVSPYNIANAAVDELFKARDGVHIQRIALVGSDDKDHGGWGKNPARNVILKHIRAALNRGVRK